MSKTIIHLTCNNIMKNAGRHWRFTFGSKAGSNQTITNQTFIVTLTPLALQSLPNWEVTLKQTQCYYQFMCRNVTKLQKPAHILSFNVKMMKIETNLFRIVVHLTVL